MQRAYAILYYQFWSVWLRHIFRHFLIHGTIFGEKKSLDIKCVFCFSRQLLFETFLILIIIQQDIVINLKTSLCKVPVSFVIFHWNLKFLEIFSKEARISSFIKMRPVGAKLFHAEGQTDGHVEANSHFSLLKNWKPYMIRNVICV